MIYKIEENDKKIKILEEDFIKNIRDNCKIIIDNKEEEISSEIYINENMKNKKIIEIKLKEYKTITNMFSMFADCSSLISLPDFSNWNTLNVTNVRSIFFKCSSLKTLPAISNWNTQNITTMRGIFNGCSSLTHIPDISKWVTQNVTDISFYLLIANLKQSYSKCY